MPERKPVPTFTPPSAPEPPFDALTGAHSVVSSDEEWTDELVSDVDLDGQVADRLRLTRCELHRVVLTGAKLEGVELVDALAVDCELSGAFLHEAVLRRVELRNCRMTGFVLSQSRLSHVRLVDCKADGANFRRARADHMEMSRCSLVEADFYEAVLATSAMRECDLRRSDFSKASVGGLRLEHSQLEGVRGALSMGGVVIAGDQVLPLALGLLSELRIDVQNEEN